jgi:hypothetical protein
MVCHPISLDLNQYQLRPSRNIVKKFGLGHVWDEQSRPTGFVYGIFTLAVQDTCTGALRISPTSRVDPFSARAPAEDQQETQSWLQAP